MSLSRRRASVTHSKHLSSMDASLKIPGPSKSTPKTKTHQQNASHKQQHSLEYTLEPTYADFLSSIDDWLDPYSLCPSESSSSSQRRKRSTTTTIKSTSGSMANVTSLKPKSRSLRDATKTTSASKRDSTHHDHTCTSSQKATLKQTQCQVPPPPRTKSRILKSPPPPPALETNQQPPSLPNVDIQQIKDELSVSVSLDQYYYLGGHADDENNLPTQQPSSPRHQWHFSTTVTTNATTSKETASVISNVKRKLSLKDRGMAVDLHHQHHQRQTAPIHPKSSRSTPSVTSGGGDIGGPKSRSFSRISLADYQGIPSSSTRRRSVYSPPPPAQPSTSYTRHYSKQLENEWTANHDGGRRLSTASISSSTTTTQDYDGNDSIPPVPPVPKHHSILANSNTSSFTSVTTTTSSSNSTENDDHSTCALEAYRESFGLLDPDAEHTRNSVKGETRRQSLIDITAAKHGDLPGDTIQSYRPSHSRDHNQHAHHCLTLASHPIMSPSPSSQNGHHAISTKSVSQQTMDNGKKVSNRKRGRTLPGSLATPPPMPSIPLPPMKLAPISIDAIPRTPQQQPSTTGALPHLSPPSKPQTLLPLTPTKSTARINQDSGTSVPHSEETIKSPMTMHGTTISTLLERSQSSKLLHKGAAATSTAPPKIHHSRSSSTSGPSFSTPSSLLLQRKLSLSSRNARKEPVEPIPELPSHLTATTKDTLKSSHMDRMEISALGDDEVLAKVIGINSSLYSTHKNHERAEPGGHANVKDRRRTISGHDKIYPTLTSTTIQQSTSSSAPAVKPKSPQTALEYYYQYLSHYERTEILDFKHIYFIGPHAKKHQGIITPRDHHYHYHHHHQYQHQHQQPSPSALPINNGGYDDENGDYKIKLQDHLLYRYEIVKVMGQGSFGQVVKCVDHKTGATVAIKLIRNKQRFHEQALTEIKILRQLVDWDPEDKHHTIRMLDYFSFRHHLCIAFECMSMNLYEFIKKNNFQGFNVALIRGYAVQMLRCLLLLYKHRVIHCDLKPENILLKHPNKNAIKVIDFGSSCLETERVYTYIQSRFYRSPEVILGISYDMAIDMWSFGCILAELHTGIPLFLGESELDQLGCIMEVLGLPDRYLIEQSSRKNLFFGSQGNFRSVVNSKGRIRQPGTRPLSHVLRSSDLMFLDFVQGCLQWDPANRMTPMEAMNHDWIQQRTNYSNLSSYQFPPPPPSSSNSTTNYQKLDEFNKTLRLRPHVHPPKTPKMTATSYIQSFRKHSVG